MNSLVNSCYSPGDIGRFVLLDVDVGGIPRESDGLIRPGVQDHFIPVGKAGAFDFEALPVISQLTEASPAEDASVHIEADWDGNSDRMLLYARYHGRRFMTLSPALADSRFCQAYVEPVKEPDSRPLDSGIPYTMSNLINGHPIGVPDGEKAPILIQVHGKPFLRYIAVISVTGACRQPRLASNCIHAAIRSKPLEGLEVIIASQGYGCPPVSPESSNSDNIIYLVG